MKIKMMRKNSDVCFEVDEMTSFTNWKSVIAWGEYQELSDKRKRYEAMKLFIDRMLYLKLSKSAMLPSPVEGVVQPHFPSDSSRSIIYRVILTEKTGRFENE
jgi:nitroimidazol reductase NimA-like FMN-containing flavoprotein (pyridoxamine 5'-phosphate oxidase superfamily)